MKQYSIAKCSDTGQTHILVRRKNFDWEIGAVSTTKCGMVGRFGEVQHIDHQKIGRETVRNRICVECYQLMQAEALAQYSERGVAVERGNVPCKSVSRDRRNHEADCNPISTFKFLKEENK